MRDWVPSVRPLPSMWGYTPAEILTHTKDSTGADGRPCTVFGMREYIRLRSVRRGHFQEKPEKRPTSDFGLVGKETIGEGVPAGRARYSLVVCIRTVLWVGRRVFKTNFFRGPVTHPHFLSCHPAPRALLMVSGRHHIGNPARLQESGGPWRSTSGQRR